MADEPRPLTKSEFRRGFDCVRRVWLDRFRPELRPPITQALQERFDTGRRIGELAWARYPQGRLAGKDVWEAIGAGAPCLFETTFLSEGRKARLDVIHRGSEGWIVDEVKMSTLKPAAVIDRPKLFDLGFQVLTAQRAGLEVEAARMVMVDSAYVWFPPQAEPSKRKSAQLSLFEDSPESPLSGAYDPNQMLGVVDLTAPVSQALPKIERIGREIMQVLDCDDEPEVVTNTHCKNCDYAEYCLSREPEHSVIYLPRIKRKEVDSLRLAGYQAIPEIPDDYGLPERRLRVRDVIRSGRPYVSSELGQRLDEIAFPAVFIDYESSAPAFPAYPGTRPYEAVCFQWSAHVLRSADGEAEHFEYLANDMRDPRVEFCRTLWEQVRTCQSIVHYSGFEIYQLKAMAEREVPLAAELLAAIQERTVDLEQIVDEHVYFQEFRGKTSIKVVLPVLAPHLSYEHLEIGDGQAASAAFRTMLAGHPELRAPLLEYCRQDTLAMVEIYRALRRLASENHSCATSRKNL